MHSRTTYLPDCIEPFDTGASPFIHEHAAAEVVSSRHYRNRFACNVDTSLKTLFTDIRKAFLDFSRWHSRCDIKQHVRVVMLFHLTMDSPRHHVTGCEILPF